MSNSTLEKLLDILRSKVIGATEQETGDAVGLITAKRVRNVSTSSSGEEDLDEEEEDEDDQRQREGEEDDGNVDDDKGTPYREKVVDRLAVIENGIKLSGPVTDL